MEIGSKVVCVDSSVEPQFVEQKNLFFQQWVVKDKIYTVREFLNNDDIVDGVLLEEVKNKMMYQPLLNRYQEAAFKVNRFRRLTPDEVYMLELEEDFEEVDDLMETVNRRI